MTITTKDTNFIKYLYDKDPTSKVVTKGNKATIYINKGNK